VVKSTQTNVFFQINHLLDLLSKDADNFSCSFNSSQASLPCIEEMPARPTQPLDLQIKHHSAVLVATTVLSGVFGTLMG